MPKTTHEPVPVSTTYAVVIVTTKLVVVATTADPGSPVVGQVWFRTDV